MGQRLRATHFPVTTSQAVHLSILTTVHSNEFYSTFSFLFSNLENKGCQRQKLMWEHSLKKCDNSKQQEQS